MRYVRLGTLCLASVSLRSALEARPYGRREVSGIRLDDLLVGK